MELDRIICGDCLDVLKTLPDCSVDTVVTDPPAGISFMGKDWDGDKGGRKEWIAWLAEVLAECYRVAKPGASLVCWAIPRTSHWTGTAIEEAGWYPVDVITHHFGTGFPKSLDIGKAIDKRAGAEREVVGRNPHWCEGRTADPGAYAQGGKHAAENITAPATDLAQTFDGYGTALKPATEFWWLARKPNAGTFAANAEKWGVAGLNIDGTRVGTGGEDVSRLNGDAATWGTYGNGPSGQYGVPPDKQGRYPANLILSHSPGCVCVGEERVAGQGPTVRSTDGEYQADRKAWGTKNRPHPGYADADGLETVAAWNCVDGCPVKLLGEQSGESGNEKRVVGGPPRTKSNHLQQISGQPRTNAVMNVGDRGTAARFFQQFEAEPFLYCAKASRAEREAGLRGVLPCVKCGGIDSETHTNERGEEVKCLRCDHPTCKPIALMRWLCRLTKTPSGGVVLDPFAGSGTTCVAALLEGRQYIGIEQDAHYCEIAEARIAHHRKATQQFTLDAAAG